MNNPDIIERADNAKRLIEKYWFIGQGDRDNLKSTVQSIISDLLLAAHLEEDADLSILATNAEEDATLLILTQRKQQ